MDNIKVIFIPEARVRFSRSEVLLMSTLSGMHYDSRCISLSKPGGKIFGMLNLSEWNGDGVVDTTLTMDDVGILAKVLEFPPPELAHARDLRLALSKLGNTLNDEYLRVNPR